MSSLSITALNDTKLSVDSWREWYLPLLTRELGRDVGREFGRDVGREVGREEEGVEYTVSSFPAPIELELTLTGLLAREGELAVGSRSPLLPTGDTPLFMGAVRKGLDLLPLPGDNVGEVALSNVCIAVRLSSKDRSSPVTTESPDRPSLLP